MNEFDYIKTARHQMLTEHGPVKDHPVQFCMAGFIEEAAEVSCVKKLMRGDYPESDFKRGGPRHNKLVMEIGDALWYLYNLMDQIDVPPSEVRRLNHEKCVSRHARGVVRGDGSER
jgi:hypothetical protein